MFITSISELAYLEVVAPPGSGTRNSHFVVLCRLHYLDNNLPKNPHQISTCHVGHKICIYGCQINFRLHSGEIFVFNSFMAV